MLKRLARAAVAVALAAAPAPAQQPADSVAELDLPEAVADAVVDFFNDPRREQHRGPTTIERDRVVRRDLAVLRGPLEVAGRVEGSVVVVNGDVLLRPGSAVTGDILVVGGAVTGADSARVGGEMLVYPGRLRYRDDGRGIERLPARDTVDAAARAGRAAWGHADFLVSTGKSYNRVEGLPITFGPRLQTAGSNPLRVHALAIYRTSAGFTLDADRMGYYVRAEQFLGGRRELRVGATAHSMVEPVEEWHLTDLENGLSTFLFHRDFRDHFEREGVSVFSTWEPAGAPLTLTGEARWERHRSLAPESPWTLFDNAAPWRAQPVVGEGDVGVLGVQAAYDTRSSSVDPSTGWLVRGRVERAFASDLRRPALEDAPGAGLPLEPLEYGNFTTGLIDVRRYNRVDPVSRLNFRLLAGGSLDGAALPPQRQHALGGEGSLPGYELFDLDCGARDGLAWRAPGADGDPRFYPAYGCDAFALLQAEFRGKLDFSLRLGAAPWEDDDDDGWGIGWDLSPDWTVFVDAGRAWALDDRPDEELRVDVGAGLLVDRLGIFLAHPLSGGGLNLFVRIGPRF